ncbi:hypothetical protein I2I11_11690 [Pontibacter sp. 172403-2]|uniref:hypothetical protein n=1 Tax=Pontibacter rufus TaxID=2791028 RepID=UPI0018B00AB2|nr:hypothetical protein [Pontibacter sp. 172403-2]MBF9253956.1 hypothetical protein [Pontibacter sp. 172403-2]
MRRYKVVILLLLLSCQPETKHIASDGLEEGNTEEHKFYDFDFEFTRYFSPVGVTEKFVLRNSGLNPNEAFKENHLYYIRYASQEKIEEPPKPDTAVVELDKAHLDSLYSIASSYMKLKHSANVSPNEIPLPPVADSEWVYAEITLDLGFRGDKHSVTTAQFSALYQYLTRMKSKSR